MKKLSMIFNIVTLSLIFTCCYDVTLNNPNDPFLIGTTVTYNSNGATSGEVPVDSISYRKSQSVTVLGNTGNLVKTGFIFVGWNTSANGSETTYIAGQTFNFNSSIILYAHWVDSSIVFSVTYEPNGATIGSVPVDTTIYNAGDIATVLGNTGNLTITGYSFIGWNTVVNGSGKTYNPGNTFNIIANNVILYAQWSSNPKHIDSLDFQVIDAEYSKSLDSIIMVSNSPNQLSLYNVSSSQITSIPLSITPLCISVSPDGHFAAIGGDGNMEYVDLQNTMSLNTLSPTGAIAGDIVLAGNGYAYIFPAYPAQWTNIRCVDISSNIITDSTGNSIYGDTHAKLNPALSTTIYVSGPTYNTPANIETYDFSGGTAAYDHKSPYWGSYSMGGNIWISENGNRVYTKYGTTFSCSDEQSLDLIYNGRIGSKPYIWIDESSERQQLVCIPYDYFDTTVDEYIEYYQSSNLVFILKSRLPLFNNGSNTYATHGKFAFYSSSGNTVSVIVQIDSPAALANDYQIVQY